MAEERYGKYVVTELYDTLELPPEQAWKARPGRGVIDGRRRTMEHMVWMDSNVIPDAFYCEAVWLWPEPEPGATGPQRVRSSAGVPAHAHPFPEILSYCGTDVEHPEELYCQVEFWMEDEKFLLDKSFACYIPAGVNHCPLRRHNMTKPLFHYAISPDRNYITSSTSGTHNHRPAHEAGGVEHGRVAYFGDQKAQLIAPSFELQTDSRLVKRITHVDKTTVPEAGISCESMWILPGFENLPLTARRGQVPWEEHEHNFGELSAFYGFNYDDITDLAAEIEFWIDGERYDIIKSFTSYIPAGMKHGPLRIKNVKRPIMHLVACDAPTYV